MEPVGEDFNRIYESAIDQQREIVKNYYYEKQIPADFQIGATRIDGLMVDWMDIFVKDRSKKKNLLTSRVFNFLMKGYLVTISITYNNERDREILNGVVLNSDFAYSE